MPLFVKNNFLLKEENEKERGWCEYQHFQNFDNVFFSADKLVLENKVS